MAETEEKTSEAQKPHVTLAEAEAKLRAAKTAQERIEAQKLVRAVEAEEKLTETAVAATAAAPAALPAAASLAAPAPQEKKHVVQKGESLSLIAKQYYGDVHKWKQIYEANKAIVGDNPDLLKPGQELVIPD
jgi:nucleoid-associated protein YgaU